MGVENQDEALSKQLADAPLRRHDCGEDLETDDQRLLGAAGFDDITELDVTPAFAATAAAWLAETEPHAEELARLEPPGAFEQRQADRRSMLAAIRAGLLRRALLLARTA